VGACAAPASAWRPDFSDAVRYAKQREGRTSIAVIDADRRFYGYRARHRAPSASVFKAMLLAAYLRKGGVRHRALRTWETRLLSPMIRRSDNAAASRVLGLVGARAIERLARRAGMRGFRLVWDPWGLTQTTARDQARFFYRFERLLPRRHRDYARRLLRRIVRRQRWGIARLELRPWRLFFKGGWGSGTGWVCHQVAWIERRHQRIALAILIQHSPSHRYGAETLRGISARLLRRLPRER
jgi:beta-lactamase family protein